MRLVFLIIMLFYVTDGRAQDYLNYHIYVNRAENHLVAGNTDSTFYYYDKVFAEYDFIFAKDALIAAQYAWKQTNKDKTIQYLMKGARNGLRSKCLDVCPVMKTFTEQRFYIELYDSMATANQSHQAGLDREPRAEWKNRQSAMVLALGMGEIDEFIDAVRENVARIKELMAKGKFPGERFTGLDDDCNKMGDQSVFYSLANYDCVVSEMHDALWAEVKKGNLHPRDFAALWEWEFIKSAKQMKYVTKPFATATAYNFARIHVKENVYVVVNRDCNSSKQKLKRFNLLLQTDELSVEEYNKNRQLYYLVNLETDEKKRELEAREGYRFFFGHR